MIVIINCKKTRHLGSESSDPHYVGRFLGSLSEPEEVQLHIYLYLHPETMVHNFITIACLLWQCTCIKAYTETVIATLTSSDPHTLHVDSNEAYIYVTDATGTLSKVDLSNNAISVIFTSSAGNCYSISVDEFNSVIYDGGYNYLNQYSSLSSGGSNQKIFSTTGYGGSYITTASSFWPQSSTIDRSSNIMYIADTAAGTESSTAGAIWKVVLAPTATSSFTTLPLTLNAVSYTLGAPKGLALNPSKTVLYFVESVGNKVSKVDLQTNAVTNLITSGITRPMGITVDSTETYAYVSTWTSPTNGMLKIDLSTYSYTNIYTTTSSAYSLQIDSSDSFIWFAAPSSLKTLSLTATPTVTPTAVAASPTPEPTAEPTSNSNSNSNGSSESNAETNNLGAIAVVGALPISYLIYIIVKNRRLLSYEKTATSHEAATTSPPNAEMVATSPPSVEMA